MVIPLSCLGFVTIFVGPAWGCSCAAPDPSSSTEEVVRSELASSEAVFAGEVIAVEKPPTPPAGSIISDGELETVRLKVSEVWKGSINETAKVTTSASSASCGYPFDEGNDYLVYTDEGRLVGLCGSTKLLSQADEDLKILGEGSPPMGSDLPLTSGGSFGVSLIGSTLLVAGGVILWFGIRRSSTRR